MKAITLALAILAVLAPAVNGATGPAITLTSNVKAVETTATITFTTTGSTGAITAGANAGIKITLSGAGIAVAADSVCAVTAPSSGSPACSVALASSVLFVKLTSVSGNTFAAGAAITVTITKFTNPTAGQNALTNIAAATSNDFSAGSPQLIDTVTAGTFPGISYLSGLAITLTSAVKAAETTATVSFTPSNAITAGANAGVVVTLSGTGIAVASDSVCTVTAPSSGSPTCSVALSGSKLTVKLTAVTGNTFAASTAITVTITKFTNPTAGQAALTNIAAASSNDLSVSTPTIIDTTATGTFPLITGVNGLAITLASTVKATETTATITFTPTQAITAGANAGIAITLSGAGIALGSSPVCTVTAPSSGSPACSATLASSVLTVKLTAGGTFAANTIVTLTVTKFTTPTAGQVALTSIAAGTSNDLSASSPVIIDTTATGTFPGISQLSGLAITLTSSAKAASTTATVSFTPSTAITAGANAGVVITLSGAGIALASDSACAVTAPSSGSPACSVALASSVLTVKLTAGTYAAATAITFTITKFTTPTAGQAALTNIAAATSADLSASTVVILDTTAAGTFPGISFLAGFAITLANSAKAAQTTATVSFTPSNAITAGANAGVVITLSGAGIALASDSACAVTAPSSGSPTCTVALASSVLTVKLTAGTYAANTLVTFTITKFTTPTAGQAALTNIAAGTSADLAASTVVILDTTNMGTFPAITPIPVPAGPSDSKKSPASSVFISASFVLAFVFAVLA